MPDETEYVEIVEGLSQKGWEEVDLADLDLEDASFQYRFPSNIGDLRASLEAEGQREPIDLTGKKPHRVIDGFRRVRAVQALEWPSIKAFVHRGISEEDAFRLAFTKNVVRKNLSPMEKANAIYLAQKRGVKKTELAEAFGLSEKQLGRYLKLLAFPKHVQKLLDGKTVTMAHAKVLADFAVRDAEKWKKRIQEEGLDSRALKALLTKELGKKPAGRKKLYMKRAKDRVRFYPFTIGKDAPKAEKEKVIKVLEEAIQVLKG